MYNKINPRNIFLMPYRAVSSASSTINDLVQNLLKKNEKQYCRKLFSILIAIPTKDKESFGKQVSSLLSENTSFDNKVRILHILDKTPSENRKILVEQTVRLISDTTSDKNKIEIFSLLSSIFSEDSKKHIDIEKLITQTLRLTSESITDKKTLLFALHDIVVNEPTINTEIIVTQSLRLISPTMSSFDKVSILTDLATIPNEDREMTIDQMCQLISDTMSDRDRRQMLRALISIPREGRDIVTQSIRLISPNMSSLDKIDIIRFVATIPPEDREVVIDQAYQLISDTMSAIDRREILATLVSIPRESREIVVTQVIRLLSDNIDRSNPQFVTDMRHLLVSLNSIPTEDREIIVTQSLLIIPNSNMSIQEISTLISLLFNMTGENREIMVRQAQQLINHTTSSNSDIIIEQSFRLIAHLPNTMSVFERISVLALINELPIEDRENFVEQAIRFVNTTSSDESTEVIIAQVYQLITDNMSTIQRIASLQMLTQVPSELRETFLVQFSEEMSIIRRLNPGEIPIDQDNIIRIMVISSLVMQIKTVFKVNSDEINENPIKVITNLFDMLNRNKMSLLPVAIKYTNSEGIDEGGITRSFITDLTNAFCKSDDLVTKGELGVIPSMDKDSSSLSIEDQKKCFKIMGRFFSAAMQKHRSIVVGKHFHPIVFEMIFSLNKDDFIEENFAKTFDKLLSIYLKKEFHLEEKEVKEILEDTISEEFKDIHYTDSKDDLIKSYEIDKKINATLIIAKSMYDSLKEPKDWDSLKGDSVDNFHEKIEGALSNNAVANAFRNNGSADEMSFNYIKKWSQSANPELLQKLVKAISGSTMLTPDIEFKLINLGSGMNKLPVFHTCSFTVELSKYSSYEEFKEKLELSLTYCLEKSGFQMG